MIVFSHCDSCIEGRTGEFQDGGGPSKKKQSLLGSHTKPQASCSLTQRHQIQTRSHPHTSTYQCPTTSSDVPAEIRLLLLSLPQPNCLAQPLDDLEALVTGEDHPSAPPIEEDCALDTENGELERFF